ncbi:hypothetical protein P3T18_001223 [Paraburkholderia sp. GAS199]|uniref:hypothetical protein n=1 Tax=Paraburkholderia sp. GAS199 TaxID=3035126 RepID=UPI003D1EC6A2
MSNEDGALTKILEWVINIDVPAITASVAAVREKNPNLSNRELAHKAFSGARWKATTVGVVSGLPANLAVAVPAAVADFGATIRLEVAAAARVAVIYDPHFFDNEDASMELLFPIFGIDLASQFAREFGVRGAMGLTREAIKKILKKQTLEAFKKIMLKYFGIKVTQKGVITKTLPIVGGIIGGGWNYVEVGVIRNRTIRYFEGEAL